MEKRPVVSLYLGSSSEYKKENVDLRKKVLVDEGGPVTWVFGANAFTGRVTEMVKELKNLSSDVLLLVVVPLSVTIVRFEQLNFECRKMAKDLGLDLKIYISRLNSFV